MKLSLSKLALLATASMLPLAVQTASADPAAKPMYTVLPAHGSIHHYAHTPTALQTWNGTITYSGHTYNTTMVGTNPANTNTTTTVTIYLIPVKMKYSKKIYGKADKETFDPEKDQWNGETVMNALLNSPLFTTMDWKWGSSDMGTTQYEDAFQRGSFWGEVGGTNTAYHVLFATPTVLTEQTIKVTKAMGGNVINNPFGSGKVGEMNINDFDNFIQSTLSKFSQINPSNFPFFIVDNVYLTSGGCCIGGYHSADNNGQTYGMASFVTASGAFSQDIDAFSHEFGEWVDDPLITSESPCGLLEVGDPLEGLANYGTFPVNVNGITYHPQALAFLEYFGAPANFSANNWLDNQHLLSSVCQNGQ
ncbi:MAG: hypothetical protein ABSD74_14195 [Rhizomicrobium sp.]|jgi:hypothetical protein